MAWHRFMICRTGSALLAALALIVSAWPLAAQNAARETQPTTEAAPPRLRSSIATVPPPLGTTAADTGQPAYLRGTTSYDGPAPSEAGTVVADFDTTTIGADAEDDNPQPAAAEPDIRLQQDRDAFESPPAGHNPQLFLIEVNPIADRRTRAFFEDDPFPHLGWRLGTFVLFQEFEIAPAWDSNVFLTSDASGDWRANIVSETRLVADWTNHALELRMLQNRSYYRQFATENDAEQTYELRGRLDVTSRTNIEAIAGRDVGQESRNSIDAIGTTTSGRADVTTDRLLGAINHRFNRLSLQLRAGLTETRYDDANVGSTNDRDVERRTAALRAQWEFRPAFSVFGEIERDDRRHEAPASTDGLSRDSTGERYRAGIALGQTGEYLRGEAAIGYGVQRPDEPALSTIEAFLVDANLAWRVTPLTSILFTAATEIDETTLAGSPGVVNRRGGLAVRHAFTERLVGEAGVSYGTQDYRASDLAERDLRIETGVEYSLNRHAALFGRYFHTRFRSSDDTRDYNASTVLFGARLRN